MHRTHRKAHKAWPILLLAVLLSTGAMMSTSPQDAPKEFPEDQIPSIDDGSGPELILPSGFSYKLKMSTKRPIKTVINSKDDVVRVTALPDRKDAVLIVGLKSGR